ncbi:MAG: Coenzyme F420 hydrogenase/dehydrogenase, beta subunit C-terminal domain [Thermodesulfobacteriota bacterium]
MNFRNVQDIAEWRLCVGCGACAYACPENKIQLIDILDDGIRPIINSDSCGSCDECIRVCPGYDTSHSDSSYIPGINTELKTSWGPILEIWEGYAADREIQFNGSSGGLVSAISLYCIEKRGMYGVLHIGTDPNKPWKNKTVLSRNRLDLLARTGSRYSPASPCDELKQIESASAPCVFIGKPCDVLGLKKSQFSNSGLDKKIGVAIGFFCAGTPSTNGTMELFKSLNVDPDKINEVRYRGKGWPGVAKVKSGGENPLSKEMSYKKSWGLLQKHRPFRCHLCPDGTSEFADISCGDPWYREIEEGESGSSLILVRSERGRKILREAMDSGYIFLNRVDSEMLEKSQKNLLKKRRRIWGMLVAMKVFGIPTPQFKGFALFKNWLNLSMVGKVRSILGTFRRIIQRRYYRKLESFK